LCPFPYFRAAQEMINDIDSVISLFHFPFAITASDPIPLGYIETLSDIMIRNEGDVQCGMMIELYARGTVKNPKIFNYLTGKFIGLNFTMIAGDSIFINTQAGKKSVQLLREGQYSNIFNTLIKNIEWLQLDVGENTFTYEAESGVNSLYITFTHTPIFEGV
ncbi:phage distal tail protein, partial [Massilicoli timonensis]|uniref:phage distal tail protein n=1 Tax=Massilicoli timonensis TaxID=2015901 RepID=UPI003AB094CA